MSYSRQDLLILAKLAEQADRHKDMVQYMDQIISMTTATGLTSDERRALSNAYKTVTNSLRRSGRTIAALEAKESAKQSSSVLKHIERTKATVMNELAEYCHRIIAHVKERLLPTATTPETNVFYRKMIADFQRYLAEFAVGDARHTLIDDALEAYKTAWGVAFKELPKTDPSRLGLALNFSVFYYELVDSPQRACFLAKYAFDQAVETMDDLPEDEAGDSIHLLQLLKDNLTLWLRQMDIYPPQEEDEEGRETSEQPS